LGQSLSTLSGFPVDGTRTRYAALSRAGTSQTKLEAERDEASATAAQCDSFV